ncbi:Hypothetical predicted protein [Pelobates cultripes]|uniref:Uncharacterized protein n=1 Tax=Pelobates cultripes TaxID=61616 RepID=A0AAD1TK09_PELCU|nr:Hypothetical predicted protein [Pelobates cultripes]
MSSHKPAKKSHRDATSVADMLTSQRPSAGGTPAEASPSDMDLMGPAPTMGASSEPSSSAILHFLAEVKGYLESEIMCTAAEVKTEITAIGARITEVEHRVARMVSAQNSNATLTNTLQHRITDLEIELEDVSNRSRCNNLRMRGLPESVEEADVESTLVQCFRKSLPDILEHVWLVDRAHRAPRARGLKNS